MTLFRYQLIILACFFSGMLSGQVVINEFSAANYDSFYDNFGEAEDWIELYNTGNTSVDLSGYHLSDRLSNSDKWAFPNGTTIQAGGYLRVWASGLDTGNGNNLHTSFKITQTKNNEDVVFADPAGTVIDTHPIDIPNQTGHSWARTTDGGNTWGLSTSPTPGNSNANIFDGYAEKPTIAPDAGFFSESVEVTIETTAGNSIYYTMDGSTPNDQSTLYTGPITVSQTSVIKAVTYSDDNMVLPSFTDFHTFFIDEEHTVPVISIAGRNLPELLGGNDLIEPLGSFELFDESGERVADATGEYNKHGNDSWNYAQRGIDYITRDQFGDDYAVKHQIFPEFSERDRFQRLIIKAAANDNYSFENGGAHIRDAFVHELSQRANLEMDERTYEPCVLYMNGEYWGVYEIREKVDDHDFTDFYYNQDKEDLDFLKTWGNTWEEYGSWDDWYTLFNFITNNDMADPANYAIVTEQFEVLSLIDYVVLHSYNVSADWLNWNTAWWRGRNTDGGAQKWRYALWDEDATYGHYINYSNIPDQGPLADPCNPEAIPDFVDFEGHIQLLSDLFANDDFFQLYINRYADLNNTYFSCDYMLELLDNMVARIEPEMPQQIDRWSSGSMNGWQENVDELRNFMLTRCTIINEGIVDCYEDEGISGPYMIDIMVEPEGAGNVRANTVIGLQYPWAATYFGGIEIELQALPNEGHAFAYWEVLGNTFGPDQFAEAITLSLESDAQITAFFSGNVPCLEVEAVETDPTFTALDLSWNAPTSNLGYTVKYRLAGSGDDWESDNVLDPAITLQGLEECTTYEVSIKTICGFSTSEEAYFNVTTACVNDVDDLDGYLVEVQVYPNPFTEIFTVDLLMTDADAVNIAIFTAQGQQVHHQFIDRLPQGHHKISMNLEEQLPVGIYLLQVRQGTQVFTKRLVKMKE